MLLGPNNTLKSKNFWRNAIFGISSLAMDVDSELLPGDSVRAVESMAKTFDARSIRYALIGGLAFAIRGRPRFTQDVDFLLEVPQIVLPELLDDLVKGGFALDPANIIKQFVREHLASFTFGRTRI